VAQNRPPKSEVAESTAYENFVSQSNLLDEEPPPPKHPEPLYPLSLKVNIETRKHAESFARLVKRSLSSDQREFVFTENSRVKPSNWKYEEKRTRPRKKASTRPQRRENALWTHMPDFTNDEKSPYISFTVTLRTQKQHIALARLVKQRLSWETPSIWYPAPKEEEIKYKWVSKFVDTQPRYPIYIVSKGRADSRLTARALGRMGVDYFIAIEPQDYDAYSVVIDKKKILILPFSNHGDGPGRARNWVWDHAKTNGHRRHWVMDDNITDFVRLYENRRYKCADGGLFRVAEDFIDRFENVPVAGLQYRFFAAPRSWHPPFVLNTRIYSCLLIDNDCKHRWRGRYNEDTILALDVLKDGDATIQFNHLLQNKMATQAISGGNTTEFYGREGTYNKSKMLVDAHPDVAQVVWRYGRWHHEVDYSPFKQNEPVLKANLPPAKSYPMELVPISGTK
jgi:hypothetical protein